VARRAIPDDLWKRTLVRYPFLPRRNAVDTQELRRLTSLFLDRKEFSTSGGLQLTDAMAVAIAAQACLPVLRLGLQSYDGFVGIVVHPDQVLAQREVADDDGVVHAYNELLAGEAMQGGPVMLSWPDVRLGGSTGAAVFGASTSPGALWGTSDSGAARGAVGAGASPSAMGHPGPEALRGYNVVIHEFAHVLDMADGVADGMPLLPPEVPAKEWRHTLGRELDRFSALVQAGTDTALDPYGAQGEEEFFAVASESFFVAPQGMLQEHPALYTLFKRYYLQDPVQDTAPSKRRA
jgi:MtfA peptidase